MSSWLFLYKNINSRHDTIAAKENWALTEANTLQSEANESVLNQHAPRKQRIQRGNNKPHVSKTLRKAIMLRSRLKNTANKTNNIDDITNYKKQRNYIVNLNKRAKKSFFSSMDTKKNPKTFWNACKPYISNKSNTSGQTFLLIENDSIITENRDIAKIFNAYFTEITSSLNIFKWGQTISVKYHDTASNI